MICSFWNVQSVTQLFKTYFITKSVVYFEMVAFLVDWMTFKIKSAFSVQSFCTVTLDFVINSPEVIHLGFCLTRDDLLGTSASFAYSSSNSSSSDSSGSDDSELSFTIYVSSEALLFSEISSISSEIAGS